QRRIGNRLLTRNQRDKHDCRKARSDKEERIEGGPTIKQNEKSTQFPYNYEIYDCTDDSQPQFVVRDCQQKEDYGGRKCQPNVAHRGHHEQGRQQGSRANGTSGGLERRRPICYVACFHGLATMNSMPSLSVRRIAWA